MIYDHNFSNYTPIINFLSTGWGSGVAYTSFGTQIKPDLYFLNGIKLLSGEDYNNTTLSGLRFKFDIPASSVLTKVNDYFISSDSVYISGLNNLIKLNSGNFCNNSSQFYVNGLRQLIDYDYVEVSKFNILTGSPVKENLNYQLCYSQSTDFWNI